MNLKNGALQKMMNGIEKTTLLNLNPSRSRKPSDDEMAITIEITQAIATNGRECTQEFEQHIIIVNNETTKKHGKSKL